MTSVKKTRAQKIEIGICWFVTTSIAVWSIVMITEGRNQKAFMGVLTIMVLVAIAIWQNKSRSPLPASFISMVYGFIFVSVGLGTFSGGYKINHFDDVLHLMSGVWTGFGGWLILERMVGKDIVVRLSRAFFVFFVIVFALAVAGSWELLEFAGDKLFHFTAQGRDHDDTMYDMIDGFIGGTVIAIFLGNKYGHSREKEAVQKAS